MQLLINFLKVYWAGPILGGVAAALLYVLAFSAPEVDSHASEKYRQVQQSDEKEVNKQSTPAWTLHSVVQTD